MDKHCRLHKSRPLGGVNKEPAGSAGRKGGGEWLLMPRLVDAASASLRSNGVDASARARSLPSKSNSATYPMFSLGTFASFCPLSPPFVSHDPLASGLVLEPK